METCKAIFFPSWSGTQSSWAAETRENPFWTFCWHMQASAKPMLKSALQKVVQVALPGILSGKRQIVAKQHHRYQVQHKWLEKMFLPPPVPSSALCSIACSGSQKGMI